MSLRIVPTQANPSLTTAALGAPSAPGVHDTLRANLSLTLAAPQTHAAATAGGPTITSSHPLESRLARWRATQEGLKMTLLRRQFGLAEPVKRQMELAIVRAGEWRPAALGSGAGSAGLHADILAGRDQEVAWEDVYPGGEMYGDGGDFHVEMERRVGMGW